MAELDTNIDIIARILDPHTQRRLGEEMLVSEQNRRVQQSQERRANRQQQLDEILAPLKLQNEMQNLKLNTLKLQDAQTAQQLQIDSQEAHSDLMQIFAEAVGGQFNNQVMSGLVPRLKRHARILTDPSSPFYQFDQKLWGEKLKFEQKQDEIQKSFDIQKEITKRQLAVEDERQADRLALEDQRQKGRIALENLRNQGRASLRDTRGRVINFDEFSTRHLTTFMAPKGSRESKEAFNARRAEALSDLRSFYNEMKGLDGTPATPGTSPKLRYDPTKRELIDPSTGQTYQFRP